MTGGDENSEEEKTTMKHLWEEKFGKQPVFIRRTEMFYCLNRGAAHSRMDPTISGNFFIIFKDWWWFWVTRIFE